MVRIKEVNDHGHNYLIITDHEDEDSDCGTRLEIHRSLLRPLGARPSVSKQNFLSQMSIQIPSEPNNPQLFKLLNNLREKDATDDTFPLLGRSIISNSVRWGAKLKISGEFRFIPGYWDQTQDVLSRCKVALGLCSMYGAIYASLYQYGRDQNIMRAFSESWCPSTNTLHTLEGELSVSLWDLYKLGGLPIYGAIYDETIPHHADLLARNKDNERLISQACDYLFGAYRHLVRQPEATRGVTAQLWIKFWFKATTFYETPPTVRPRSSNSRPKSHDPTGELEEPRPWSVEELRVFESLGVSGENKKQTIYTAAFLVCWLCVFVLPESDDRLIRPQTFEIATRMAHGETFSLAIPVLASIYRGLNGISRSKRPGSAGYFFPAHYLYVWLAYYFDTHHDVEPRPPGPMMVKYSRAQGAKSFGDKEARALIHTGRLAKVGCTIFNRNRNSLLYDDGKLGLRDLSYLISLRSRNLILRQLDSFHVEPYVPHRFSRKFGFCQDVPTLLFRSVVNRSVSYKDALKFWILLLFEGSQSQVCAPSYSIDWHNMVTIKFNDWWHKVRVIDLTHNVDILCESTKPDKCRKSQDEQPKDVSQHEGRGENSYGKTNRKTPIRRSTDQEESASDDVNHKHKCWGSTTSPYIVAERNIDDFGGFFYDVPSSDIPIESQLVSLIYLYSMSFTQQILIFFYFNYLFACFCQEGDLDIEVREHIATHTQFPLDNLELASTPQLNPRKGKQLRDIENPSTKTAAQSSQEEELAKTSTPSDSMQSVEGPHSLEVSARALGAQIEIATPIKASVVRAAPTTSFCPRPYCQDIFVDAIRGIGSKFLEGLKNAPFSEVRQRFDEVSTVYKGIEYLKGDPSPLKKQVERYVGVVDAYLTLERSATKRKRSEEVEKDIATQTERVRQIDLDLTELQRQEEALTVKQSNSKRKINDLEIELRNIKTKLESAHEEDKALTSNLALVKTDVTSLVAQAKIEKEALADLIATPSLSIEEEEGLAEKKREILEEQSSIKPLEWMDFN